MQDIGSCWCGPQRGGERFARRPRRRAGALSRQEGRADPAPESSSARCLRKSGRQPDRPSTRPSRRCRDAHARAHSWRLAALEARTRGEAMDVTLPGRGRRRRPASGHADDGTDRRDLPARRLRGARRARDRRRVPQLRGAQYPGQSSCAGDARHLLFSDGQLLRTHTSPVQIRAMAGQGVPIG